MKLEIIKNDCIVARIDSMLPVQIALVGYGFLFQLRLRLSQSLNFHRKNFERGNRALRIKIYPRRSNRVMTERCKILFVFD